MYMYITETGENKILLAVKGAYGIKQFVLKRKNIRGGLTCYRFFRSVESLHSDFEPFHKKILPYGKIFTHQDNRRKARFETILSNLADLSVSVLKIYSCNRVAHRPSVVNGK